jgi:hypothetical protein
MIFAVSTMTFSTMTATWLPIIIQLATERFNHPSVIRPMYQLLRYTAMVFKRQDQWKGIWMEIQK